MSPHARPDWTEDPDVLYAIECALEGDQLLAVHRILDLAGIAWDAWLAIPALAQTFGGNAALVIIADLQAEEGLTFDKALTEASFQLRIPKDTVKTWIRRWRTAA